MKLFSLDDEALNQLVYGRLRRDNFPPAGDAPGLFSQTLRLAARFVPSEAGSILLDDPAVKLREGEGAQANQLVFISSFGPRREGVTGHRLAVTEGVVGHAYSTGQAYRCNDTSSDPFFSTLLDQETGHQTRSLLAVPIIIGSSVCGVVELVNRLDGPFSEADEELMELFARYLSTSMQNLLDARRAREQALRDHLTGVYNDRFLSHFLADQVEAAQASGQDLTLIFIDLDNFKKVNDRFGHLAGSQVLREIAGLIHQAVDQPGAILARYGGDEFAVACPSTPLERAREIAETIRCRVEEADFLGSGPGLLSTSIGIARHPGGVVADLGARERLLQRADGAMYLAKTSGKNRIVMNPR